MQNRFQNYITDISATYHEHWDGYLNLYPTKVNFYSIGNRSVVENLENNGDSLTKAREVFHWIFF